MNMRKGEPDGGKVPSAVGATVDEESSKPTAAMMRPTATGSPARSMWIKNAKPGTERYRRKVEKMGQQRLPFKKEGE